MTRASFRAFMRGEIDARGTCQHCGKAIERRATIWYTSGETVAADLCLKVRTGEHAPIAPVKRARRKEATT